MRKILFMAMMMLSLNVAAQTHVRKTNLPHVYINTWNRQSITSKDTYIYCDIYYVDENDVVTHYDSVSIRGRGNSTWGLNKKPYKIKFKEKTRFLGQDHANAKKWTLLANAGDKTLIRNAITSEMMKFMGMEFCPAAKFVDLTLNNVYVGNYQISDQVDVRKKRVNVQEQDYPLTATSDITGGYLLEVDGFKDGNWFGSSKGVAITIHYPEDEECAAEQKNYIRNHVNEFESHLFSTDFKDPELGYRPYVDSLSMANLYLTTEISGNIDGFWSTYFYKYAQNPKLFFGPGWDYDIAYDNDYRITNTTSRLMVDEGYGDARTWFKQMWNDSEWFSKLINRRFAEVVDAGLEQHLYEKIDSLVELIYDSQKLNFNKWGISSRIYHECYLYGTYEQYIEQLKNYIHDHIVFLEQAFANRMPQEPTPPFEPRNYYYNILNANTNTAIDIVSADGNAYSEENLPPAGSLICGWANEVDRQSEYWRIDKVGDYYMITNRLGLALNDPTTGTSTATTNTGTQLNVEVPNQEDTRQLWILTPQGTQGYYNLTNVYTQHTANLSGGNAANGTTIISYTTDDRNSSSMNRLFYIKKTDIMLPIPPEPVPTFTLELAQGWNWASHVMESPLSVLEFDDNNVQRVVAQTKEAYNDKKYGLTGSLTSLSAGQLFKIYMTKEATYTFEGSFCNATLPVALKTGWNWVGYTQAAANTIAEAVTADYADEGDIIMGQQGFSLYENGVWAGTLTTIEPGAGYLYWSNATKAIRFSEVPETAAKRRGKPALMVNNDYAISASDYPDVMGIVATLRMDGAEADLNEYIILAYADGVCRGVGQTIAGHCFLTVYGNGGEPLQFKAVNRIDNTVYDVAESDIFSLGVKGSLATPVVMHISGQSSDATAIDDLQMASADIQAVYSLSGSFLGTSTDHLPAGIYIVRFTNGTSRKIVLR